MGAIVAALQVLAVIALRAHWTMDVLAGLFAAMVSAFSFGKGRKRR